MIDKISEIEERVRRWSNIGEKIYDDGTILVGHVPAQGELAYLHALYGPLSDSEIEFLEEKIKRKLPERLRLFYQRHNGCHLFLQNLFVYGLRRSWKRSDLDLMSRNPFDIYIPAMTTTPCSLSGQGFAISGYDDKSIVFIETDGSVMRMSSDRDKQCLNQWHCFDDWLFSEFDRLSKFFDEYGNSALGQAELVPTPN